MNVEGNRIMSGILLYTEQEVQYRISNPENSRHDLQSSSLQLEYYENLLKTYKKNINKNEIDSRKYLKNEIRRLKASMQPGLLNSLRYGRVSRWLRVTLTFNLKSVIRHKNLVQGFQNKIGIDQNLIQLTQILRQKGFTQNIDNTLKKMITHGLPKFHLRYSDVRHPQTDYILYFNLIPGTGAYTFSSFDAAHRPDLTQSYNGQEQCWKNFPVQSTLSITATDAARLTENKAICIGNNQWIMLDKMHNNLYKTIEFDIRKALDNLPLYKMNNSTLNTLISALKTGASKEAILTINGEQEKCILVAAPHHQAIWVQNEEHRIIDPACFLKNNTSQSEKIIKLMEHSHNNVININSRKGPYHK